MTVLSALYGAVLLSSMLLPPLLIRALGCKWTIVLSMGCYVAFSLGNFYASWYPGPVPPPPVPPSLPAAAPACLAHGALPLPLPLLPLRVSSASAPLPPSHLPVPSAPPTAWVVGLPRGGDFQGSRNAREPQMSVRGRFQGDSGEGTLPLSTDRGRALPP